MSISVLSEILYNQIMRGCYFPLVRSKRKNKGAKKSAG